MSRGTRGYDDLQAMFLMRLVRLMKLRTRLSTQESTRDAGQTLVSAALRSTLQDCEALGVQAEAHALLEAD
ncbi:MAG: hypothetical protein GEU73_00745 [Chloroflexi bacterium]|nr:hypothetical protein [Chloroflexota bacterium]